MSGVDMSPEAVTERLRLMSRMSDLRSEDRLATKIDMSPEAVTRRLRQQSKLREFCLAWKRIGEANGLGRGQTLLSRHQELTSDGIHGSMT